MFAVVASENINTYHLPFNISYNSLSKPTQRQVDCLAQNIYHEAGRETREGQIAVALVTLNRLASGNYANDICGVVNQKTNGICQFSWVCNPPAPVKYVSDRWNDSLEVATEVMYNGLRLPGDAMAEALYFHNTQVRPHWGLERVAKIGNHIFYSDDPAPKKLAKNP